MAEEAPPKGKEPAGKGKGLGKKIGPLPAWGWGVIVVGGILGIMLVRKWMADQAGASASGASITGGGVGSGGGTLGGGSPLPTGPDVTSQLQDLASQIQDQAKQQAAALDASNQAQLEATNSLASQLSQTAGTLSTALQGVAGQATAAQATADQANAVASSDAANQLASQASAAIGNFLSQVGGAQFFLNGQQMSPTGIQAALRQGYDPTRQRISVNYNAGVGGQNIPATRYWNPYNQTWANNP